MATVNLAFNKPFRDEGFGVTGPIRASENITSSGTSAQSTNTFSDDEVCMITVTGGSVYIKTGSNPTAASGDFLILDGSSVPVKGSTDHKIAVIDA
jgi:hypothetical protein